MERLVELHELLVWIDRAANRAAPRAFPETLLRIRERVHEALGKIDLRICPDCGHPYIHSPGSRHYRCSNCRWKRHLVISTTKTAPGGTRQRDGGKGVALPPPLP